MVVSEIGEQWSPQTAPAMQAEIAMVISVGLVAWNASTTIGIRIPKVPQEVPVANAKMCIRDRLLLCSKDRLFQFFQLRSNIAFCIGQGLLADIILRHQILVAVSYTHLAHAFQLLYFIH